MVDVEASQQCKYSLSGCFSLPIIPPHWLNLTISKSFNLDNSAWNLKDEIISWNCPPSFLVCLEVGGVTARSKYCKLCFNSVHCREDVRQTLKCQWLYTWSYICTNYCLLFANSKSPIACNNCQHDWSTKSNKKRTYFRGWQTTMTSSDKILIRQRLQCRASLN